MIRRIMTVGGRAFAIPVGHDVDAIKSEAVRAIRAGGGLIEISTVEARSVAILVTPSLPLFFEEWEVPDDVVTEDTPSDTSFADFDDFI